MKGFVVFTLTFLLFTGLVYSSGQAHTTKQMKETEVVGNEICPVSGEKINEEMKQTYEYKGRIYSFCCLGCVEEFKKNPEKYIEKMKEPEKKGDPGHGHHEHHHSH